MKYSTVLAAIAALPALVSAFGTNDLYAREAEALAYPEAEAFNYDNDGLYAREASIYDERDLETISKVERAIYARSAEADAYYDAHLEARDELHTLVARAALAYPEAFADAEYELAKRNDAKDKLAKLTDKYHADQDKHHQASAAHHKNPGAVAAQAAAFHAQR